MADEPILLVQELGFSDEQTASSVHHASDRAELTVGHRSEEMDRKRDGQHEHLGDA